jgi:hypothetical protein
MWSEKFFSVIGILNASHTVFFPRFGWFSAIISLNRFSTPLACISSSSSMLWIITFVLLIMSQSSGKLWSWLLFFLYCCLNAGLPWPCLWFPVLFLLFDLVCGWCFLLCSCLIYWVFNFHYIHSVFFLISIFLLNFSSMLTFLSRYCIDFLTSFVYLFKPPWSH